MGVIRYPNRQIHQAQLERPGKMHKLGICLTAAIGLVCLGASATQAAPTSRKVPYQLAKTVKLGAPDRWDYLTFDSSSNRVFISHSDRLTVVDAKSGKIVGTVDDIPGGTHGIGIVPSVGRGYTDDGKAGVAWAFDLKTLKKIAEIKAQPDADGITYDSVSGHIFVIDGDSGKITVIDPKTNAVVTTIDGGGGLEFGVADGQGHFFVNGAEKGAILRIDTANDKIDATWHLADCQSPHGMAVDSKTHRIFSSCENKKLVVVNADTGAIVTSLPIGTFSDAVAFDPIRKRIFSSNFDGTVNVFAERGPDTYEPLATIPTKMSARTMTVDPKTGALYLVAADMKVNEAAQLSDFRHRFTISPGSTQLMIFRPTN
jgi:YVTN family beta-propeller protein